MIEVKNSLTSATKPSLNMLCYGQPGVGKTSFGASGMGKTILIDAESGSNLLALREINVDIVSLKSWDEMKEVYAWVKEKGYETVVLDPLGELLDKLLSSLKKDGYASAKGDSLTLQGWGVAKERFREMIRAFRDLKINTILVAHSAESKDEDAVLVRPKLQAHLDEDVCAMMDIVGYLKVGKVKEETVRRMYFSPTDKFYAKDRSGQLPEYLDNASFKDIMERIQANPVLQKLNELNEKESKNVDEFSKDLK